MVAGFDTYHKKEGDRQAKSFGAFTASLDPLFGRYYSQCLSHTAGEEISQNLPIMFAGALKAYKEVNNAYPQRIFFTVTELVKANLRKSVRLRSRPSTSFWSRW